MYNVKLAEEIAIRQHKGQTRWNKDIPYITHPIAVAWMVEGDLAKSVALLHDVIEDTDMTAERLLEEGIHKDVVDAVVALTKIEGEDYYKYLTRVASNEVASIVKIADIQHNMSDLNKGSRKDKYQIAISYLRLARNFLADHPEAGLPGQ